MPTVLTHPVVAVALAPLFRRCGVSRRIVVAGMLCTVVPDLDVIGMRIGIPYDAPFGHRGFTHSLAFAAVLGGVLALLLQRGRPAAQRIAAFVFLFLCTASHGVLDALTDGGHGIAFFAPFDDARYFFPWRPIEVSPLGVSRFLSGQAWPVLLSELHWIVLPALAFATVGYAWNRRAARP